MKGLIARWRQHFKYDKAVRIARKRGATIGEEVTMPISLAKAMNSNVTIGSHVSIAKGVHFSGLYHSSFRFKLEIHDNVIIGTGVKIVMGGHNIDSTEWEHARKTEKLVIEDYVWLCNDSVVLPSCSKIGRGAVIGANAVVVKDVDEMAVMGGNPAKELRKRQCVHSNLVVESLLGGDYRTYKTTRNKK